MMFQNYTPFRDVYYHFECVTTTQFARFAAPDGTIKSTLQLRRLAPGIIDMIDDAVFTAFSDDIQERPTKVLAVWQRKKRNAAKRRARRQAKRSVVQRAKSRDDMEVDGEDELEVEESVASGTEYSPDD